MGAWGSGSFENDDAGDWAFDLEEEGVKIIESALNAVASEDYVEAPECSCAIAAAEVVAAAVGRPTSADTCDEVEQFLAGKPAIGQDLVDLAKKAMARVLADDSELRELWEESDSFDEWKAIVTDLQARLEG
jgi:hypothetical protein